MQDSGNSNEHKASRDFTLVKLLTRLLHRCNEDATCRSDLLHSNLSTFDRISRRLHSNSESSGSFSWPLYARLSRHLDGA